MGSAMAPGAETEAASKLSAGWKMELGGGRRYLLAADESPSAIDGRYQGAHALMKAPGSFKHLQTNVELRLARGCVAAAIDTRTFVFHMRGYAVVIVQE